MSINLPRNIVFNNDGEFYTASAMVDGTVANGNAYEVANPIPAVLPAAFLSSWKIPDNREVLSNVELLAEVSIFNDLMQRKMNFIHLFKTLPSVDTRDSLKNFMNALITAMLEALKTADDLYWLNRGNHTRSQYTLDYCLRKGCELAAEKLKLQNMINDIKLPDKLVKEHVEDEFEADIRKRSKNLNIAKAAGAEKTPSKKAAKKTNKKS